KLLELRISCPLLEERLEGPVEALENLLSCLRVELPQQRVPPPLGGENPALLAVRGGETLLLPAPLPVGEGVVPEPPRCLYHPEKSALLLVVRIQTESERCLHVTHKIIRSYSI